MATTTVAKTATILYRVQIKRHPGIVVYQVLSSDEATIYDVTTVDGKVNNCTCKSRRPCYHMSTVQKREDERKLEQAARRELYCQINHIYE